MARDLPYWSYDPDQVVTCSRCEWSGRAGDNQELFAELLDVRCGVCDAILLIVSYPTVEETRLAAARGNVDALEQLHRLTAAGQDPSEETDPEGRR